MIKKLLLATSHLTNPYINLAYEDYLFNNLEKDTFVFYLWSNDNTILLGLNQNAYRECNVAQLIADGGYVARRKTGGGTVYTDKDNFNFTFIADKEHYDIGRQLNIILEGVKSLGVQAERSGRNDLIVSEGLKFSGNAFMEKNGKALHHGTMLINTEPAKIMKYLTPRPVKLIAKGVSSVLGRVVNLSSIDNTITVPRAKKALTDAFIKQFEGIEIEYTDISKADKVELERLTNEFKNESFVLGRGAKYSMSYDKRFEWGTTSVEFNVHKGIITDVEVFTDSLNTEISKSVMAKLKGMSLDEHVDKDDIILSDIFNLIKYGI